MNVNTDYMKLFPYPSLTISCVYKARSMTTLRTIEHSKLKLLLDSDGSTKFGTSASLVLTLTLLLLHI